MAPNSGKPFKIFRKTQMNTSWRTKMPQPKTHLCVHSKTVLPGQEFLTDTFLGFAPVSIASGFGRYYDDMRVLAFEVDFPVERRKCAEEYQGFTWVRLDQLVFNFYELRLMLPEIGMDDIWKAAQKSRHKAFVSTVWIQV
jgi:hypothetical protein